MPFVRVVYWTPYVGCVDWETKRQPHCHSHAKCTCQMSEHLWHKESYKMQFSWNGLCSPVRFYEAFWVSGVNTCGLCINTHGYQWNFTHFRYAIPFRMRWAETVRLYGIWICTFNRFPHMLLTHAASNIGRWELGVSTHIYSPVNDYTLTTIGL